MWAQACTAEAEISYVDPYLLINSIMSIREGFELNSLGWINNYVCGSLCICCHSFHLMQSVVISVSSDHDVGESLGSSVWSLEM